MKLTLKRIYKGPEYTIGHLYIGDEYFADTLEDKDRGLTQDTPLDEIFDTKVYGETAIPTGTYTLGWTYSPKYKKYMISVNNVPGWSGVRIHSGNTKEDTLGCILVGKNKEKGKVLCSKATVMQLNTIVKSCIRSGGQVTLKIE